MSVKEFLESDQPVEEFLEQMSVQDVKQKVVEKENWSEAVLNILQSSDRVFNVGKAKGGFRFNTDNLGTVEIVRIGDPIFGPAEIRVLNEDGIVKNQDLVMTFPKEPSEVTLDNLNSILDALEFRNNNL